MPRRIDSVKEQVVNIKRKLKSVLPTGMQEAYDYARLRRIMRKRMNMTVEEKAKQITEQYEVHMGRTCDLENPCRFTEKIQWTKAYHSTPQYGRLADKYLVRQYVAERVGEKYLTKLLGIWEHPDEINFDVLPDAFALKATHGSGWNIVVKEKATLDERLARRKLARWLKIDFGLANSLESHYTYCEPRIIAEEYMEEIAGGLYDYKIHCFGGKPCFIQCIGDRDLAAHTGYQRHLDLEWKNLGWTFEDYPQFPYELSRPGCLEEMLEVASALSKGLAYVRVDLYDLGDRVLFGEMTLTPGSGFYPYRGTWTEDRDSELGALFELPDKVCL